MSSGEVIFSLLAPAEIYGAGPDAGTFANSGGRMPEWSTGGRFPTQGGDWLFTQKNLSFRTE